VNISTLIRFDWFFLDPEAGRSRLLRRAWYVMLYLSGAAVWVLFLNRGQIGFDLHDWTQEGPRLYFLQAALRTGQLPLHIDSPLFAGERFLSIPDTLFSPQILLLKVLDPGPFVLVNLLLMYTFGMAGTMLLAARRKWSPLTTTFVFLLFNFNGQLTAQLAVGHTMWMTAFLLPFLVLLLLDLVEGTSFWPWVLKLSLLLLGFFLQGGFHFVTWTLLLLLLIALALPRFRRQALAGAGFSLLLCLPRILPAAVEMAGVRRQFISGFHSLTDMLEALVVLKFPYEALEEKYTSLAMWEVDSYIGLAGLLLLAFGVWRLLKAEDNPGKVLLLPLLLYTLLSLGKLYQPVTMLPIPLFNAERVTTRFLLPVIYLLAALSADQLDAFLKERPLNLPLKAAASGVVLVLGHDLLQHTRLWRLGNMAQIFPVTPVDIAARVLQVHDPQYFSALWIGMAASAASILFLAVMARREMTRKALVSGTRPPSHSSE